MAGGHSLKALLHEATHRVPGVPPHHEHPAGHQGTASQRRAVRHTVARDRTRNGGTWNHSHLRPPRVLAAWQRRIAHFFGQQSR